MAPSRPQRRKGRQAVRNNQGGFPGWGWAIIGLLGGALLMWFLVLHKPMPQAALNALGSKPATQASSQAVAQPAQAASTPTLPKKPQYDFYSVLPEKDVRIPDAELSAKVQAEQQAAAPATPVAATTPAARPLPAARPQAITAAPAAAPASGPDSYLLQIGAFPNSSDAEALKAKLAMQGFMANVQTVSINGQTYHRVRLGPFQSATQLEGTKQRLAAAGIHAIALKEGH